MFRSYENLFSILAVSRLMRSSVEIKFLKKTRVLSFIQVLQCTSIINFYKFLLITFCFSYSFAVVSIYSVEVLSITGSATWSSVRPCYRHVESRLHSGGNAYWRTVIQRLRRGNIFCSYWQSPERS